MVPSFFAKRDNFYVEESPVCTGVCSVRLVIRSLLRGRDPKRTMGQSYYCLGRLDFYLTVPAVLLAILAPLFLTSSVFLSYFILAVPMRECLFPRIYNSRVLNMVPPLFARRNKSLLWPKLHLSKTKL